MRSLLEIGREFTRPPDTIDYFLRLYAIGEDNFLSRAESRGFPEIVGKNSWATVSCAKKVIQFALKNRGIELIGFGSEAICLSLPGQQPETVTKISRPFKQRTTDIETNVEEMLLRERSASELLGEYWWPHSEPEQIKSPMPLSKSSFVMARNQKRLPVGSITLADYLVTPNRGIHRQSVSAFMERVLKLREQDYHLDLICGNSSNIFVTPLGQVVVIDSCSLSPEQDWIERNDAATIKLASLALSA